MHWYWEGPYGGLLWHDTTYELADSFGVTWDDFTGTGANDGLVQRWLSRVFWLYLVCMVCTLTAKSRSRVEYFGLALGFCLLTVLSYAKYVDSQFQVAMFIEHGGQMLMPLLLASALWCGARHWVTHRLASVALIMTFAGHGAYAVGISPTPSTFYAMTSVILGVPFETAEPLLFFAGSMDFIVCVAIFVPRVRRMAALYAVAWGFATAIARPVAGMSTELLYWGADQYLHEAILRAPHFMIPLYLFLVWKPDKMQRLQNSV